MPSTGPRWRGKANDIDPTHHQGPVAFGEAKGVVVIIKDGYIRGYRMTKEKSLSKYDPLPSSQGGPTGLRMQIKVTAVKGSFHTRFTSAQTDLMLEALRTLQGWGYSDEALAVHMLRMLPAYSASPLVRTRDPKVLETCHTVVDVGGESRRCSGLRFRRRHLHARGRQGVVRGPARQLRPGREPWPRAPRR